jgi:hypothetical protein
VPVKNGGRQRKKPTPAKYREQRFESSSQSTRATGLGAFAASKGAVGQARGNMEAAGIDPRSVEIVAISFPRRRCARLVRAR